MRRTIFAAVPLAVLALAAPAAADGGGRHATTYKAELAPVAGEPEAAATRNDREAEGVRGKAKLVDGPRRDKVRLHVRGLTAGGSYSWSVRQASGDAGACSGEAVDAFGSSSFDARRRGRAHDRARSRTFAAEEGARYAVVVTDAEGVDVACGEFESKASRKAERKAGKDKEGKHGDEESEPDADEQEPCEHESGEDEPEDDELESVEDESGEDF